MAHEIKTPLSSALLSCDMVTRLAHSDHRLEEHSQRVKFSVEKAITTCQSILSYSRTWAVDKSDLLIDESIEDALALLAFRLKPFQIIKQIDPALTILADRNLMLSVWSNLLSNAIEACGESGCGQIKINAYAEERDIHIKIVDDGCGFSADETVSRQSFTTTKQSTGGTGLGLNIVSAILKSHQGKLVYEPQATGVCAHVVIPSHC